MMIDVCKSARCIARKLDTYQLHAKLPDSPCYGSCSGVSEKLNLDASSLSISAVPRSNPSRSRSVPCNILAQPG